MTMEPTEPPERQTEAGVPARLRQPNPASLTATIRRLSHGRKITYMNHAEKRFHERGFDVFDMYRVLELGQIEGAIEPGKKKGEWKAKMVGGVEGTSRRMGVVTIVVQDRRLLIKTVEWEDK